jgi:superfamily II DNA or RNA helicase
MNPEMRARFGAVILDEAHHAPASTFEEILNVMPATYRFGFTATDKRADGREPYMRTVGPVIYRSKFSSKIPVKVIAVKSQVLLRVSRSLTGATYSTRSRRTRSVMRSLPSC